MRPSYTSLPMLLLHIALIPFLLKECTSTTIANRLIGRERYITEHENTEEYLVEQP